MSDKLTPDKIAEHIENQQKDFKDFREAIESKMADTAEGKEKIAKIEKSLEKHEDFNQKLLTQQKEDAQDKKDLEKRFADLEKKAYRMPNSKGETVNEAKVLEFKELTNFMETGKTQMKDGSEYKTLRTDNDVEGGFLVQPAPLQEIIKKVTETSNMRAIAKLRTTVNKSIPWPVRTTLVSTDWAGENVDGITSNSTYGKEEIFTHTLTTTVPITMEEIQDAAFNMESEIMSDVGESMGQKEGNAFVVGDGSEKPQGFRDAPQVEVVSSGIANSFTGDNIINFEAELKTGYRNPILLLTRKTLAFIRTLKDGQGQYLLVPGISGGLIDGLPNTINGFPFMEMPDMDEIAADAIPLAFGSWDRAYCIVDRVGVTVIRDVFTQKKKRVIELSFSKRVGGQVILPDAIKLLKLEV